MWKERGPQALHANARQGTQDAAMRLELALD